MDDLELRELFKRLAIAILIILVFATLTTIIIYRNVSSASSSIDSILSKNEDTLLLVREQKCSNCKKITNYLNKNNIKYQVLNIDKEKYLDSTYKKLNITAQDIIPPSIIYIKEKEVYSILIDITEEEKLKEYLKNNNLLKE